MTASGSNTEVGISPARGRAWGVYGEDSRESRPAGGRLGGLGATRDFHHGLLGRGSAGLGRQQLEDFARNLERQRHVRPGAAELN